MFTRTESFREFIRLYPIVTLIVAIQIIAFLFSTDLLSNEWLLVKFAGVNLFIWEGEYWRLLTPLFLHANFSHLLFNCFSLILFGPALETMIGKTKFLLVFIIAGITANVATLFLEPLTYTHVGSSGAIFGIFGFYISIILFRKGWMTKPNSQLILSLAVISLVMTFIQPNVNIVAHLFGFLAGFIIGLLSFSGKKTTF
ncbi:MULTISPECIES: rhomboid family intramembrane serine protease [unclassified Bacillus (in: firmicutes)]|uniref:rhomboid family intramembrane serine protease n=1 Tax=unclassified Bacillus (in: firmicutes) TaxID=185979 RepID=UPI0008E97993|nr:MULTISPECIES: rhomboid family intramembrane serine protease [unclassified Bacillus (in: firmicutes)]SFB24302.1 Membrane associated serine protease, rhomboid family [Bacillus sp. UNCCL13]SFQ91381.1 Membrane associated serine protease, rhomboid family [Bacillus sp. cl95]